jgi:hypothetical protein
MQTRCTRAKIKLHNTVFCDATLCRLIDCSPTYPKNLLPPSSGHKSKPSVEIKRYGYREREEPDWNCKLTNGNREKTIKIIGP